MIEPTDEMVEAFFRADKAFRRSELERLGLHGLYLPALNEGAFRAALAAVFAIVERDHDVSEKLPPVEHKANRETWFNPYAAHFTAECSCGEEFASGYSYRATDLLLEHIERQT